MVHESKYTGNDICAIIVTYNPGLILLQNLTALLPQVGYCVIIDNGSSKKEVLETVKTDHKTLLICMSENRGIAFALNRGAELCRQKGYPLMLTMDQDTVLASDAVKELLKAVNDQEAHSAGINWDERAVKDEIVSYLITSGNLVTMEAVNSVGGYDEKLFIDSVDFDFSLRLKDHGFKMIKVARANASHHLGEQQEGRNYTTHSVERYYYIYRNHFYMLRKYWKRHLLFCIKKQVALVIDLGRIVLFDKQRKEKIMMLKKGYRDSRKLIPDTV